MFEFIAPREVKKKKSVKLAIYGLKFGWFNTVAKLHSMYGQGGFTPC